MKEQFHVVPKPGILQKQGYLEETYLQKMYAEEEKKMAESSHGNAIEAKTSDAV